MTNQLSNDFSVHRLFNYRAIFSAVAVSNTKSWTTDIQFNEVENLHPSSLMMAALMFSGAPLHMLMGFG